MDFIALKKLREVDAEVTRKLGGANPRPREGIIDIHEYRKGEAYHSASNGANSISCNNKHASEHKMLAFHGQNPQPINKENEMFSFLIQNNRNTEHLPQDFKEFRDVYERQYTYYNSVVEKIYEVVFIDAIDADSSGTIGDHADDEFAKILIRDMDKNEISSYNLDATFLHGEKFAAFGSIYLGKEEIMCTFRLNDDDNDFTGNTAASNDVKDMIIVKIGTKMNTFDFVSPKINIPHGQVTMLAETDYNNKTVGFIHTDVRTSGKASASWLGAMSYWTYVDYNWDTSAITSHTGPFTLDNRSAQGGLPGWAIGSANSMMAVGAYHIDRGFGLNYSSWSSKYTDMGMSNKFTNSATVTNASSVFKSLYTNSFVDRGNCFTKSEDLSWLKTVSRTSRFTNRANMWSPLGFTDQFIQSASMSATTNASTTSTIAYNVGLREGGFVLKQNPWIPVRDSKAHMTHMSHRGNGRRSIAASGSMVNQHLGNKGAILDVNVSNKSVFYQPFSPHNHSFYSHMMRSKPAISSTQKVMGFENVQPGLYSSNNEERGGCSNLYYNAGNILAVPRINGLGLLECTEFSTFVHYKDSYIGSSIDED